MTYSEAYAESRKANCETGMRMKIYKFIWDGGYVAIPYFLAHIPHSYAILVGEVGGMTAR